MPVDAGSKGPTAKCWPSWPVGDDADGHIAEHFTTASKNVAERRLTDPAGHPDVQERRWAQRDGGVK